MKKLKFVTLLIGIMCLVACGDDVIIGDAEEFFNSNVKALMQDGSTSWLSVENFTHEEDNRIIYGNYVSLEFFISNAGKYELHDFEFLFNVKSGEEIKDDFAVGFYLNEVKDESLLSQKNFSKELSSLEIVEINLEDPIIFETSVIITVEYVTLTSTIEFAWGMDQFITAATKR